MRKSRAFALIGVTLSVSFSSMAFQGGSYLEIAGFIRGNLPECRPGKIVAHKAGYSASLVKTGQTTCVLEIQSAGNSVLCDFGNQRASSAAVLGDFYSYLADPKIKQAKDGITYASLEKGFDLLDKNCKYSAFNRTAQAN